MTDRLKRHRRARHAVVVLAIIASAGAGVWLLGGAGPTASRRGAAVRPNPGTDGTGTVFALARLEPASGLIAVGSRPGTRIESILVKEGDRVKKDDLLALLEGHDEAERQAALAEARKADADHQRTLQRDKLALERKQYDQLKAPRLDAAQRVADLTRKKLQEARALGLVNAKATESDPKLRFEFEQALFQLETASIKADLDLKSLQADQALQVEQRALEDRHVAEGGPDDLVLTRQVELARAGVAQAEVRAPGAGIILDVLAHAGEVGSGPLLTLGDTLALVAQAEVYQTDVPAIAPGDPAGVVVLGRTIAGKVTKIGRVVGRNQLRSLDPRALQDLRVVVVTIALDDPDAAANYMNMQVDVSIRPRRPGGDAR